MRVIAAPGLQVPKENSPREYITADTAVTVERSAYYIRQLACGDLIEVEDEAEGSAKTSAKRGAK